MQEAYLQNTNRKLQRMTLNVCKMSFRIKKKMMEWLSIKYLQ